MKSETKLKDVSCLSVATLNCPFIEIPAPPPIVIPSMKAILGFERVAN